MDTAGSNNSMSLTNVLRAWAESVGWSDEIVEDHESQSAQLASQYGIKKQTHKLYFEIEEKPKLFSVYLYTPYNVPRDRIVDMSIILNRINSRLVMGRLAVHDDGEDNPVQFQVTVDVEGSSLGTQQITNMLSAGGWAFSTYGQLLTAIALTQQPVEEAWSAFRAQHARESEGEGVAEHS